MIYCMGPQHMFSTRYRITLPNLTNMLDMLRDFSLGVISSCISMFLVCQDTEASVNSKYSNLPPICIYGYIDDTKVAATLQQIYYFAFWVRDHGFKYRAHLNMFKKHLLSSILNLESSYELSPEDQTFLHNLLSEFCKNQHSPNNEDIEILSLPIK